MLVRSKLPKCLVLDVGVCEGEEGGFMCHRALGAEGREFSILTAWWKKLSFGLAELAQRLRNLLPEGRRLKRQSEGWVGSNTMLNALWVRRVCCKCPII